MLRSVLNLRRIASLSVIGLAIGYQPANGASLDKNGEIGIGLRAYGSARIQTEDTDIDIKEDAIGQTFRSLTFPRSSAGHLRQSRYFVEAEFKHNIQRLYDEGFGPLALLKMLPFELSRMRYQIIYRGEYEGVFDYGPRGFRTATQFRDKRLVPDFSGNEARVDLFRRRLRKRLTDRHRLFQAFLDFQVEDLFVRVGRQILVWGETDAFRLMDNINPVDNGFGGFLIPLDERRVPLDMLRLNYYLGDLDKIGLSGLGFSEAYLEAFWAFDNAVGWSPGINIKGSPWALPNLGEPSATQWDFQSPPARNIENSRGGIQFKFNAELPGVEEATFGVAHYYTFFDTPQVQSFVSGTGAGFPVAPIFVDTDRGRLAADPHTAPAGNPGGVRGFLGVTEQQAERTQVTGLSSTFAIPAAWARQVGLTGEPIIRTELAYFRNEPRHQQEQLDPFTYSLGLGCGPDRDNKNEANAYLNGDGFCTVDPNPGDSWNFVLGIDTNQFIRWINPQNSFFITTQFFYKHLNGASKRELLSRRFANARIRDVDRSIAPPLSAGEVLPVPAYRQRSAYSSSAATATQPNLVHSSVDQFLQTVLISSQFASGQVVPSFTFLYDWAGAVAAIPSVTFLQDPFRLRFSYSYLNANKLKGNAGVSLLRDRDSFLIQVEYVI